MHCFVPAGNMRGHDHNYNVVNCLIERALFAISDESTWRPPCDGTVAVVMVVCDKNGNSIEQTTIASVPLNCDCEVSHASCLLIMPQAAAKGGQQHNTFGQHRHACMWFCSLPCHTAG